MTWKKKIQQKGTIHEQCSPSSCTLVCKFKALLSVITPTDPYPLVGSTLVLNCTASADYPANASAMFFRRAHWQPMLNSEQRILSDKSIQLVWRNLTEDQRGYVFCWMGEKILTGTEVNVGCEYPSSNFQNLTRESAWAQAEVGSGLQYLVVYRKWNSHVFTFLNTKLHFREQIESWIRDLLREAHW